MIPLNLLVLLGPAFDDEQAVCPSAPFEPRHRKMQLESGEIGLQA
jgi:hypothetical protein